MKRITLIFALAAIMLMGTDCRQPPPSPPPPPVDVPVSQEAKFSSCGEDLKKKSQKILHLIGESPCPDFFRPMRLDLPSEAPPGIFSPGDAPPWLEIPDVITPGETFVPKFTCDIDNFARHDEEAVMTFVFTPEGGEVAGGGVEAEGDGYVFQPSSDWDFGDTTFTYQIDVGPRHEFSIEEVQDFEVQLEARQGTCP